MNTKVQLFNDQEAVNAILTHRDDERLVCENIAPLGSHIPRTTYVTYREAERRRRGEVHFMDMSKQVPDHFGVVGALVATEHGLKPMIIGVGSDITCDVRSEAIGAAVHGGGAGLASMRWRDPASAPARCRWRRIC